MDASDPSAAAQLVKDLQEQQQALLQMLQGLPDLVFRFNREGRLISVKEDPNLIQPVKAIENQLLEDVLEPQLAQLTREKILLTLKTQKLQTYEYLLTLDGQERHYEARMVPLNQDEVLALSRDMTEQILTRQALENSNKELEQFAYVASHDLRQPLRMISSYIELLTKRWDGRLDEEEQLMMGFVQEGSKRMDQMLVSLLHYSRVGRKGEPMQHFNSQESFQEAFTFLGPQIKATQAKITPPSTPWPNIYASRDELTRLFQNLLGNALKYQPKNQQPEVEVTCQQSEGFWLFNIKDNGIGINPAHSDRLFQVFQRLHTREEYEGSGIGLALCRKVVERHGGKIWVESEGVGKGSCFFFTLPIQNPTDPLG